MIRVSSHNTGEFTYNGIDRIDSDGGYTPDNIVACCKKCNIAKSDMTTDDFLAWIRRISLYQKM